MKVLVTGAGGFIGQEVVRYLHGQYSSISVLVSPRQGAWPSDVDAVLHLAARIPHREGGAGSYAEVNVDLTRELVTRYTDAKMVFASTLDVEREVKDLYADSKATAEKLVSELARFCIIRLPSVFGPKMLQKDKLTARLIDHFARGGPPVAVQSGIRSHLYVKDAARVLCNGLFLSGVVRVEGYAIENSELEALVSAASRFDAQDPYAIRHPTLFHGLIESIVGTRGATT